MKHKGLGRLLAVAVVSTLAIVASGCASDTDQSDSHGSSGLVTSGPTTGDLFVHGTILRDGDPVRGARVVVELWPTAPKKDTAKMSWDTRPVTTDAQGAWSISLDPTRVPRAYLSPSRDHLAFNVQVIDRSQFATWSDTMYRIEPSGVWRTARTDAASPVLGVAVDLDRKRVVLSDSQGKTTRSAIRVH